MQHDLFSFFVILVRAECVRCLWLLAKTKVATVLGIFKRHRSIDLAASVLAVLRQMYLTLPILSCDWSTRLSLVISLSGF